MKWAEKVLNDERWVSAQAESLRCRVSRFVRKWRRAKVVLRMTSLMTSVYPFIGEFGGVSAGDCPSDDYGCVQESQDRGFDLDT